jgi:hypothetical protein
MLRCVGGINHGARGAHVAHDDGSKRRRIDERVMDLAEVCARSSLAGLPGFIDRALLPSAWATFDEGTGMWDRRPSS